ncbi:MAG: hypothetical protein FJ147_25930 [Deltaproteobacteria bacterium]|nr:hypothetical protein [Deltaproteobacteria bacterium]
MRPGKSSPATALHLDTINQCLRLGGRNVPLTPKAFLVLRHLMGRPGQLVTKEELLNAVWPEVYVSDAALKVMIRRLRQALGDEAQIPRFIETIPWRGYRFIGAIASAATENAHRTKRTTQRQQERARRQKSQIEGKEETKGWKLQVTSPSSLTSHLKSLASTIVGREAILSQLHSLLSSLLQGNRQTVFLTGEPGIGKTAIVEAFLAEVAADPRFWVVSGQCIEHYGPVEPYLPILDALERLCRLPGNERFVARLRQYASMWLVHMPSLISATELKRLRRSLGGTTSDRMLREFAEVLEHLTAERPLVLVIEDVHWSDSATLDLLAFLTRRAQQSRLLVLSTYRPEFVTDSWHPLPGLTRELSTHRQSLTIAVGCLDEAAVLAYLTQRFPSADFLPTLAHALYQRTEGNPLFMLNIVEYLIAQGALRQEAGQWQFLAANTDIHTIVPANVQQLIEMQIERLAPDEQHLLEVASAVGTEFSAAAVAAATDSPIPTVEEHYTQMTRRFHFLRSLGISEWPDGTLAQQYTFIHSLYQNVFYQRMPAGKRTHVHARIGQQLEAAYGTQAEQIAVELAMHFERGRDFRRAVQYRRHAAETALQRYAYREAIEHFTVGLELLKGTPTSEDRVQQEIAICSALGTALTATHGYASVVVERTYARAHALWQHASSTAQPFPVLLGLWGFSHVRAELQTALVQAHQLLEVAETTPDPQYVSLAHNALGSTLFWQGDLSAARQHYENILSMSNSTPQHSTDFVDNPGVLARSSLAVILSYQGETTLARTQADDALALAEEQAHYYSLALARCHIAAMYQIRRALLATQAMATTAMTLAAEKGFPYCLACSTVQYGWARAMQTEGREGIEQIRQGCAAYQATGAVLWHAYFLALLAEAQLIAGQTTECLQTLAEGIPLARTRGQRIPQIELCRIKGELLLASESEIYRKKGTRGWGLGTRKDKSPESNVKSLGSPLPSTQASAAEQCFLEALELARAQQARALEFRLAIRLSRLWQQQGNGDRSRHLLTPLYERLSNEQDSADLHEAQALLTSC